MPNTKISALTTATPLADNDLMVTVDVSDISMAPSGTNKKTTAANVAEYVVDARLPYFDVATYGAVGNGVADDTAEISAAITAAAAVVGASSLDIEVFVELARNKHYMVSSLTVPKGVVIRGNGAKIQANTAGTIITLTGYRSGVRDAVIFGVGGATDNLGIHMSSTSGGGRQEVRNVVFDALGGRAILCEAIASWVSDCVAQGCLTLAASLGAISGVCELNTTDCWVTNSEFTASRSSSMSATGFAYAVVVKGGTHTLQGVIGEISDHGFYVAASNSRLIGCRADLNRGHGFVFTGTSSGALTSCLSLRNSLETTNTYDGFNFANNSRWQASDNVAQSLTADSRFHRYGFYDATTGLSNYNQFSSTNRSNLHATNPVYVDAATGSKVDAVGGPFINIAAAATTINVQAYDWPTTNYSLNSVGAVNMTDFTNEITGMRIYVIGDGFTTFVHDGAKIVLKTFANTLAVWGTVYQFVSRNGIWWQV